MSDDNDRELSHEEKQERRRHRSLAPEKIVAVILAGATFSLALFSAALGAYGQLQRDTTRVNERVIAIDGNVSAIGESHTVWAQRLLDLERELGAVREKAAILSERVVRCEGRSNIGERNQP